MNILLINPPSEMLKQEGVAIVPPLGLLYIGAVLEKSGHTVKILDCVAHNWKNPEKINKDGEIIYKFNVTDIYLKNLLHEFKPQFIGITNLFATSENNCLELAKKLKNIDNSVKIIIGGTNASARAEFLLSQNEIDFVVKGEGEYIFRDLADCIQHNKDFSSLDGLCYKQGNKNYISANFSWVKDLNELPFPAYHLLLCDIKNYFQGKFTSFSVKKRILTATTSRGCVRNCVFCSGMRNLGHWRARTPENVIKELKFLIEKFRIEEIAFVDPNINLIKERFVKIMELMRENNLKLRWTPFGGIYVQTFTPDLIKLMAQTGCHSMNFAVEHGDDKMQEYIGKIVPLEKVKEYVKECKKNGVWSHGYFVVGLPGETEKTLKRSYEYAKEANFDSVSFFIGTPLPGSRLYDEVSSKKELNSNNLRFISKNIWWTELEPDYLVKTIKKFMAEYAKFKIINEIKPKNLYWRIKTINRDNLKLYYKVIERFLMNFIVR